MKKTHPSHGFTLIELLIALACVAVLASLAWPSYQSLILKSQRAQARASLLQTAHWFERAASANGSYPFAADVDMGPTFRVESPPSEVPCAPPYPSSSPCSAISPKPTPSVCESAALSNS